MTINYRLTKRICVYLIIIALAELAILYYEHLKSVPGNSSLGNELSAYLYVTNTAADINEYEFHKKRTGKMRDKKLQNFYKNLQWQKEQTLIPYQSSIYETWNQYEYTGIKKENYLLYWQTVRPYLRKLLAQNITSPHVSTPVVHFRCSDAPFIRYPWYNLTKKSSVEWMAEQIKQRGFKEIIFLNCHKHKNLDLQNSCNQYTAFYVDIFEQAGLQVTTQCGTIYNDFAAMVYAPLLVSLNSSSYSFMAGIAKDPQNYISCNMGFDTPQGYLMQSDADWILDQRPPLSHKDVTDYHDTAAVIKLISD